MFYLDQLAADVLPSLGEEVAVGLERLGRDVASGQAPIRFGTWVGGDRDGNPSVTPEVTMRVLEVQHDHALRSLISQVETLAEELSTSSRYRRVSDELSDSLATDRQALPEVWLRFRTLNRDEPYRLKCAFIHERLANTRRRHAEAARHVPGEDYRSSRDLLDDLGILHRSLHGDAGELIADGVVLRLMRNVRTFGFHLATMDIREHAERHHYVLEHLYARIGISYARSRSNRPGRAPHRRAHQWSAAGLPRQPTFPSRRPSYSRRFRRFARHWIASDPARSSRTSSR